MNKKILRGSGNQEKSARERGRGLRKLLDNASDAILIINKKDKIVFANKKIVGISGYSQKELAGKKILDFLTLNEFQRIQRMYEREARAKSIPKQFQTAFFDKKNRKITVDVVVTQVEWNNEPGSFCIIRDISKEKKIEAALKESQKNYQELVENINDVIFHIDNKGKFIYISPVAERVIGYKPEEVMGHNISEFIHPRYLSEARKRMKAAVFGNISPFESEVFRKDGSTAYIRSFGQTLMKNGKMVGVMGVITDITDRKKMEDALRESENKFRDMYENAPFGIFHSDWDGKFIRVNPSLAKMLRYDSPEEFIQKVNQKDIAEHLYVDNIQRAKIIKEMEHSKGWKKYENQYFAKDGKIITAITQFRVIRNPVTKKRELEGFAENITDKKQAEEKYRHIFENALVGIYRSTPGGKYIEANLAFAKMLGYKSPEELKKNVKNIPRQIYLDPKVREKHIKVMERKNLGSFENRIMRKDGSIRWIANGVRAYRDHQGKIVYFEGVAKDITDKKEAEEALRKSEEKYRQLVENLNDVVYLVNKEGIIEYASPAIEKILGYKSEEIIGKSIFEFGYPEDVSMTKELFKKVLKKEVEESEHRVLTKNNETRWIKTFSRIIYKKGSPFALQGIMSDVTERREAEEKMLESYKYLGTINRQMSVIIGLSDIIKEKNKKRIADFVAWSALEISNSEAAILYKFNCQRKVFHLMSLASHEKISKKDRDKISSIPLKSSEFLKSIIKRNNIDIDQCFEKTSLGSISLGKSTKYFCALPLMEGKKIKGILVFGSGRKKEMNEQEKNFYKMFIVYSSFLLSNIGALE